MPNTSTYSAPVTLPFDYGLFVISIDFELHWGVRDKLSVGAYRDNLLGVREVIPTLPKLFKKYGIDAT